MFARMCELLTSFFKSFNFSIFQFFNLSLSNMSTSACDFCFTLTILVQRRCNPALLKDLCLNHTAKLRIKKTSQMVWNVLGMIWERIGKIKVLEGKLFRVLRPV